jgi:FHS family Na+ dependent glucose MFS transporter 1
LNRNIVTEPVVSQGGERIRATIGYYLALVSLGLAVAVLGPTLLALANQTQTDESTISILFVTWSLGYMLGSLQGGRWYDRLPGHRVLAGALFLMAGMLALTPVMSQLWLLTLVVLVLGVAEGVVDVGSNTLLVWVHRDRVGPWINGLHLCFAVGASLTPLILAQTMWPIAEDLLALGARTVGLMGSPQGPGPLLATSVLIPGKPSDDVTWSYWVLALLMVPGAGWILLWPGPVAAGPSQPAPAAKVNRLLVFWIALFLGLYVGAEIGFGSWIFQYTRAFELAGKTAALDLVAAFWGAFLVGRLLGIPLAARLRPHWILLGDLVGCLVSVAVVLGWPHSLTVLWLGTLGLGLSMASIFPTTLALAERRLAITGQVTSWFIIGGAAGQMALPWLMGQLFEPVGPRVVMWLLVVDLLAAVGLLGGLLFQAPAPTGKGINPRKDETGG